MDDCIFCKIIKGTLSSYKIWEDDKHVAILDIFPESRGMTVLIPKKHVTSHIVNVDNPVLCEAMVATKKVGSIMDEQLEGNIRTTYSIEGLELDHLHIKLIPFYREDFGKNQPQKADEEELKKIQLTLTT